MCEIMEIEKAFEEIIGYDSIKKELYRICDIMRNEEYYTHLGVNVPSGLLLDGKPGVGKTTMANCFIKASGRPAFICRKDKSNGDFVKFIKECFEKAAKAAPSIVLLDDMDKFANEDEYHRNAEEFVTVQSCIDEYKGKGVFVFATINDGRALPSSLTRAGRFDNCIEIENPSGKDAENIVAHYIAKKNFVAEVNVQTVARLLNGASCAELETVINEAGIYAGYARKDKIEMDDIISACMRIIHKAPETGAPYSEKALKRIAYHEAGHAVVAELLNEGSVNFVSVRRHGGGIGGFTSYYQDEDYFLEKRSMENRVLAVLGGKAATEIVFGETDVGANSDLHRAFDIVTRFVDNYCSYGFDKWVMDHASSNDLLNRKEQQIYSEMDRYYHETKKMLIQNRTFLDKVAQALCEKDVLTGEELRKIKNTRKAVA